VDERRTQLEPGARDIDRLLPMVYAELRALASSYLRSQPGHTLQPTALVHEAYLKIGRSEQGARLHDREHFLALAATVMRQVLVDHARRRKADKRGGGGRVQLDLASVMDDADGARRAFQTLELDDLLTTLATADPRAARVAELRLFGGMSQDQIATVLSVSRMTVTTDWGFARAWLASHAGSSPPGPTTT